MSRARRSAAAIAALLACVLACRGAPRAERDDAPAAAAADSIGRLDPFIAYRRALALGERRRFLESLPYFERAASVPTPAWEPHCDYAISLFQATHQVREHLGQARSATRSSFERVQMMHEALRQLALAEERAASPADRAFVIGHRARYLSAWGLRREALDEYRRATALDPAWADAGRVQLERLGGAAPAVGRP